MANFMISSILSSVVPGAGLVDLKSQLPVGTEGSFAIHLDRQLQEGVASQGSLVGVPAEEKPILTESLDPSDPPLTVEAVLQQLMVDLKAVTDKTPTTPGQWTFQLQDMGHLEKLAAEAGMESGALAPLRKLLEEKKSLPLADLFASLEQNFKQLDEATKVTVEETNLPLLSTFLAKLKVDPETIQHLDAQGVNGIDQLDLNAYLQGLEALPTQAQEQTPAPPASPASFILSDWEVEQLSTMLTQAGVPMEKVAALIPERPSLQQKALAGLRPEEGNLPVTMTLDRLTAILEQAVALVNEARPRANMPGFFNELNTILTQAGFESHDVGWTPVVQGTMEAIYNELQKMIDLAMVKVEVINGSATPTAKLEAMLNKILAARQQQGGGTGNATAEGPTAEDLSRALRQAIQAVQGSTPRPFSLPEFLNQVNAALAPAGFALTATAPVAAPSEPMVLVPQELATLVNPALTPLHPESVRQALQEALSGVAGFTTQTESDPGLPGLLNKVNTILAQAGITITPATSPEQAALNPETMRQALQQAIAIVALAGESPKPTFLSGLLDKINATLAQDGLTITTAPAPAIASRPESVRQAVQQALMALAGERPTTLSMPSLPTLLDTINASLAQDGLVITAADFNQATPAVALSPETTVRQVLQQAIAIAALAGERPTTPSMPTLPGLPSLPTLLDTINASLTQDGFMITAADLNQVAPAVALSPETTVRQVLQQALAALDSEAPQAATLPERLGQVNATLAPAGLTITSTYAVPAALKQTPPPSPEAVLQVLRQALAEIATITPQSAPLPGLAAQVDSIVSPAEFEITTAAVRQPAPRQASSQPPVVSLPARETARPAPLPDLLQLVNTTLNRAGLALTPTLPEPAAPKAITAIIATQPAMPALAATTPAIPANPNDPGQLLASAISAGEAADPSPLSQPVLKEQIQALLSQPVFEGVGQEEGHSVLDSLVSVSQGERQASAPIARTGDEARTAVIADGDDSPAPAIAAVSETATADQPVDGVANSPESSAPPPPAGGADHPASLAGVESRPPVQAQEVNADLKFQAPRPRVLSEMQQLAAEQISQGVLRGLRNNDHHLALTLYPKELGEVKVDLQVRGGQLSVNFVMENQKVKEAMESSMGEFKDNLERRGFSLGAMSVSVDQHHHPSDSGKRFMATWEQTLVNRQRTEQEAPVALGAPANFENKTIGGQQGGISLFV